MKLIIDILDSAYKVCYDLRNVGDTNCLADILANAVGVGTPIPDNATNGDVIKAIFPNGKVIETGDGDLGYEIFIEDKYSFCSWFDEGWWNAKYQKGGKE